MRKTIRGLFYINGGLLFTCFSLAGYYSEIVGDTLTANLLMLGVVGALFNLVMLIPIMAIILWKGF